MQDDLLISPESAPVPDKKRETKVPVSPPADLYEKDLLDTALPEIAGREAAKNACHLEAFPYTRINQPLLSMQEALKDIHARGGYVSFDGVPEAVAQDPDSIEEGIDFDRKVLGKRVQEFIADPAPHAYWVSNLDSDRLNLYINGLNTDSAKISHQAKWLTDITGQKLLTVVNNSDTNVFKEWIHAVMGVISSRLGHEAEPEAVENFTREIKKALAEDRRIRIFTYSQGAIIASNALFELQRTLSKDQWQKLNGKIKITAFGPGIDIWPEGVEVNAFSHKEDWIPRLTSKVSAVKRFVRKLFGRSESKPAKMTYLPTGSADPHSLEEYTRHFSDFFIESHRDETGKINARKLAEDLYNSILHGELSDQFHCAVICKAAYSAGNDFVRRFYELVGEDGFIGEFPVPFMDWRRAA